MAVTAPLGLEQVEIPYDRFSRDVSHMLGFSKLIILLLVEPVREKTNNLHGRKQRRRSASR